MSLSSQLSSYLKATGGWVSGKSLEDHGWNKKNGATYKASNVSRRLRELAEDGTLESKGNPVEYRYKTKTKTKTVTRYETVFIEGRPVAVPKLIEIQI